MTHISHWRISEAAERFQTVAELPQFIRDAEAALGEDERWALIEAVAAAPLAGDEVKGSGGIRKVRFAGRGKGKSGGYRVMTFYVGRDAPVYLIALLSKGDRTNFAAREIAAMKELTMQIRSYWKDRKP